MYSLLLLALSATSSAALHHAPEQIHIAFGKTPDMVAVQWSTRGLERAEGGGPEGQQPRSFVYWGKDPTHLDQAAEGLSISFVDGGARKRQQQHHVVNMTGLEASTRYHYQVGDPAYGGLSHLYSFKTAADAVTLAADLPIRLAIYGDMGVDKNGSTVVGHLLEHMHGDPNYLDGVLHVGDFAYDMDERDGVQGDLFMRQIEPVAARLPYMTSMGNHEKVRWGGKGKSSEVEGPGGIDLGVAPQSPPGSLPWPHSVIPLRYSDDSMSPCPGHVTGVQFLALLGALPDHACV
jgi:hypothetical protein